jgi:hypothetical protein
MGEQLARLNQQLLNTKDDLNAEKKLSEENRNVRGELDFVKHQLILRDEKLSSKEAEQRRMLAGCVRAERVHRAAEEGTRNDRV